MTQGTTETLDLTPSPRILEMIAEVDLRPSQCLAELIDNAFDELQRATAEHPDWEPRVDVTVPTAAKAHRDSLIQVGDNGRGMTKGQLEQALKAGASGNLRFGSLGLFGMGFNVATARLGRLTTVRSGRVGDDHWTVVQVDLDQMTANKSFKAPVTREPKDPNEHGTLVTVTRLQTSVLERLQLPGEVTTIRRALGRIYSYMLRTVDSRISGASVMGGLGMGLYVNNKRVKAEWPCIWDPSRSVAYMGQSIPAVEQIDIPLTAAWACMTCGHWHAYKPDTCTECGGAQLEQRERRIWGWLGIQRYIDPSDFGISLFRQGRSIVTQDKSLFEWESPDGTRLLEYPTELGQGRIVGEIHLDHAPVNFRKTDFDRSSQAWQYMVDAIRGEAPLKPKSAKRLGYSENRTPLARLFNAYRRHDPGLRCLIPGDGHKALNAQARAWAEEFRSGTPGYESDEKWFDAAQRHAEIESGEKTPADNNDTDNDDWFKRQGLEPAGDDANSDGGEPAGNQESDNPTSSESETEEQRVARYKEHGHVLPELDGKIRVGKTDARVRAYVTGGVDLLRDGILGAPFYGRFYGGVLEVFVDERHPLILDYGWSNFDAAVVCAAPQLKSIYEYTGTVDELIVDIMAQFPDQKISVAAIRSRAEALLDQLRTAVTPMVEAQPDLHWNALHPSARRDTEKVASKQSPEINWAESVQNGRYAQYLTVAAIRDMLIANPQTFMDGAVFTVTYATWLDEDTKQGAVNRIAVLLDDLQVMLSPVPPTSTRELIRLRLSADILVGELANP